MELDLRSSFTKVSVQLISNKYSVIANQTFELMFVCSNLVDVTEAPGVYILGCHVSLMSQIERAMSMHEVMQCIKLIVSMSTNAVFSDVRYHYCKH